jgi:hypothetical protein
MAAPEADQHAEIKKNIKAAFGVFDKDERGLCDVREIGTIIRYLHRRGHIIHHIQCHLLALNSMFVAGACKVKVENRR